MKRNLPQYHSFFRFVSFNVFIWLACLATPAYPQAEFLKDINEREDESFNEFSSLTSGGDKAFYVSRGTELWTSYLGEDGQEVGLKLGTFESLSGLTPVGSKMFFVATTSGKGSELYISDGTVEGTHLVKDIHSGSNGSSPAFLTSVNGVLYFAATNGSFGKELWRSDGSSAGTFQVRDIFPKAGSSNPSHLTNVNGVLYFAANDGTNGYELWKSDGSATGTVMVKDIKTGTRVSSSPEKFVNGAGVLYFTASESATGRELYRSDGTVDGTYLVKDIRPGTGNSSVNNLIAVNNEIFFTATDGVYGEELWKSDGTANGTLLVKDMTPGAAGSHGEQQGSYRMGNFYAHNGVLFYTAYERNTYYIWKSDGSTAGTVPLEIAYGPGTGQPTPRFIEMNGLIFYFNAYDQDNYSLSLKRMNPDGSNPDFVYDIYMSSSEQYFPELVKVRDHQNTDHLYFYGVSAFVGMKLMKTNGDLYYEGTEILPDPYIPTVGSHPNSFRSHNGKTYFIADASWYDNQSLMVTDGTAGGTQEVIYFSWRAGDFDFTENYVYGAGKDWLEVYRSSGDLYSYNYVIEDYNAAPAEEITPVNANVFFKNEPGNLYHIDDNTGVVQILRTHTELYDLQKLGSNLIYRAKNATNGEELWRSNGTATGTIRYMTISTTAQTPNRFRPSATIRNTHFFVANDGVHGNELWRTQGSGSSTYMITDLNPNDGQFVSENMENDIRSMIVFRDSLYMSAVDQTGNWSLLKTNGTAAGFKKVMNINQVVDMVVAGQQLFLFSLDAGTQSNLNLYVTNGTAGGTHLLKQFPGTTVSHQVINNVLYVRPQAVMEMWRSDGTACGTTMLDAGISFERHIGAIDNKLIFSGQHPDLGYEPYVLNTSAIVVPDCESQLMASSVDAVEWMGEGESRIAAYPNPFNHDVVLNIPGNANAAAEVEVFTISGTKVEALTELKCNTDYHVGVAWPNGVYVLKVNSGGKIFSQKVMKQR